MTTIEITHAGCVLSAEQALTRDLRKRCTAIAADDGYSQPTRVCVLKRLEDGRALVPLHLARQLFPSTPFKDARRPPVELVDFPDFNGLLKSERGQIDAHASIVGAFQATGGGVLALPTGFGKTAVALAVAASLKVKVLVIVHKKVLMEQWIERVETFLPCARVGIIQGPNLEVDDKHVVVAMLQSLSQKSYEPEVLEAFDLVIVDECHHVAAPTFSKALAANLGARYTLGLSATPERKDCLTAVIEWQLGPVVFQMERREAVGVTVEVIRYDREHYRTQPPEFRNGQLALCQMLDVLCSDEARNALNLDRVRRLSVPGRSILLLSDRRAHCIYLHEHLPGSGLFIGGQKAAELERVSRECQIIVATYSIASEGLDVPRLNALIQATPKSDVRQSVGRILRGGELDSSPLVVDLVDKWGPFLGQARKRRAFYVASGFSIGASKPVDESGCLIELRRPL
jgi:superfamily II DNA or RNA helicase